MSHQDFSVDPNRRDRFVFQYPPFATMQTGVGPDFSKPLPPAASERGLQIYLHIPFCKVRCTFCYYNIVPNTFRTVVNPYLEALLQEIDLVSELPYVQDREVETVYFGGGTPTYLHDEQLERLISRLKSRFRLSKNVEFTSESEPTTITKSKLQVLKELGITRMSFGIQSFHWEIARLNGRIAKPHIVRQALEWAKETGFPVMNIDLMSGMLDETMATWKESLDVALAYEPEHLTIYRMEIKPGTQLFSQLQLDPELRKKFTGDEAELEMIDWAEEQLADRGYRHHTHFSWIKEPEHEHLHRTNCWRGKDLIAIGESAFGYANGYLYQNANHHLPYGAIVERGELPVARAHKLSRQDQLTSYMVMGMKLLGIDRSAFREKFDVDPVAVFPEEIAYLEEVGAVEVSGSEITVTEHGCLYADSYVTVFYSKEYLDLDELRVNTPDFAQLPQDVSVVGDLASLGGAGT